MEVRAAIDEADVGKLKEGLEARFTVDAYPGQEFLATIHRIRSNPNVQQNVVTYDAILRVDNPDQKLRPGMTANVRIVSQRRENVLRVPNAALRFKPPPDLVAAAPAGQQGPGGPGGPGGPVDPAARRPARAARRRGRQSRRRWPSRRVSRRWPSRRRPWRGLPRRRSRRGAWCRRRWPWRWRWRWDDGAHPGLQGRR